MKYKPCTFITVPSKYKLMEVDAIAQSIFLWLCDYMNRDTSTCFPNIATLAKHCKISRNTVKNRIARLEKVGLIKKTVRKRSDGRNMSNLYHIIVYSQIPNTYRPRSGPSLSSPDPWTSEDVATNSNHIELKPDNQREGTRTHSVLIGGKTPGEFNKKFFESGSSIPLRMMDGLCKITKMQYGEIEKEIGKFIHYWTEPTLGGEKQRWELEKTFDARRRILSWLDKIRPERRGAGAGVSI